VFLGTPQAAAVPLGALVENGWAVDLVVTRPDKRRRRNKPPEPSPVKAAAIDLGLTVTDRLEDILETDADLGVVVAYGRIIPTDLLDRFPMVNLHFSLLPRWRGAAPVERALLAGDADTGVCVMQVEPELDAGPVYARATVPIGMDPVSVLRDRLVARGTDLLMETLSAGLSEPAPQEGDVTYAEKIESEDLRLDWSRPADELMRVIRLERAWTMFRGDRLRVLEAAPGDADGDRLSPGSLAGAVVGTAGVPLRLLRVQPAGRAAMSGADWARGARMTEADVLGDTSDER
jgi:methionyl-tRNA formyltransferase